MNRLMLSLLPIATALGVSNGIGHASSSLRDALGERFTLSRIEVQNPSGEGRVVKKGTVLLLQSDRIPANTVRFVQPYVFSPRDPKPPRAHAADYARVEVGRDGRRTAAPGELSLAKGSRLVVLDLKVEENRVRLFTHTLDPVRLPNGTLAQGCTEFVFAFDPATLDRADVGTVASRIDQWLAVTSAS
jgi:hypothetical protein